MNTKYGKTLAASLLLALSASGTAWAGDTCELSDGAPGTEYNGGALAAPSMISLACGESSSAVEGGVAIGGASSASGTNSTAVGSSATALGATSSAFGFGSYAAGANGIAIGYNASAYEDALAVGTRSTARQNGTALGNDSKANAEGATAVGLFSSAAGYDSTAMGLRSDARADAATAVGARAVGAGVQASSYGYASQGMGNYSTAVGAQSRAEGVGSVAVGMSAVTAGAQAVAIGQNSSATADRSVALGIMSVADRSNTVSVGRAGDERQIVNVADATQATDAINLRQLDAAMETAETYADAGDARALSAAQAYTDRQLAALGVGEEFNRFRGEVNDRFASQDGRIDRIGALGAAMAGMASSASAVSASNTRLGMAVGSYRGSGAVALGVQHAFSSKVAVTFGAALASHGDTSATVGLGIGL